MKAFGGKTNRPFDLRGTDAHQRLVMPTGKSGNPFSEALKCAMIPQYFLKAKRRVDSTRLMLCNKSVRCRVSHPDKG